LGVLRRPPAAYRDAYTEDVRAMMEAKDSGKRAWRNIRSHLRGPCRAQREIFTANALPAIIIATE